MTNEAPSPNPYARARLAGGLIMLGLAAVLMLVDAGNGDTKQLDTIQLGLVLGTALALLGVEGFRAFIR